MANTLNRSAVILTLGLILSGCDRREESVTPPAAAPATRADASATARPAPPPELDTSSPSGFDAETVPVVDPPLGAFPYFGLIEGYERIKDGSEDVAFDRYEFFDGERIVPVEGRLMTIAAEGKGASAFEVLETYESLARSLGGVTVFEGTGRDMTALDLEFEDMRHRHPCFQDDRIGVYVLRTAAREIWVEAFFKQRESDRYYLTVVERKRLEARAGLLPAERMKEALDTEGHVALDVAFDFDEAVIRPESHSILDEVAKLLAENPELRLTVEGHTDVVGTPDYNRRLSEARAAAVVAALTARGVGAGRLAAAGYGAERPVADNGTDAGRALNRRVELVKAAS